MTDDPHHIYQINLDRVTQATLDNTPEGWRAAIHIPHVLQTLDAVATLTTVEELDKSVRDFLRSIQRIGADGLDRYCLSARFIDDETIEGTHNSVLMKDGARLGNAYSVRMVLKRIEGQWKVTEAVTLLRNRPLEVISPRVKAEQIARRPLGRS